MRRAAKHVQFVLERSLRSSAPAFSQRKLGLDGVDETDAGALSWNWSVWLKQVSRAHAPNPDSLHDRGCALAVASTLVLGVHRMSPACGEPSARFALQLLQVSFICVSYSCLFINLWCTHQCVVNSILGPGLALRGCACRRRAELPRSWKCHA
eukprot:6201211-Pleurochrysis_carterae.AAC.2